MSKVCDIQQTITSRQLINTVEPDSLLRIFLLNLLLKRKLRVDAIFITIKRSFSQLFDTECYLFMIGSEQDVDVFLVLIILRGGN